MAAWIKKAAISSIAICIATIIALSYMISAATDQKMKFMMYSKTQRSIVSDNQDGTYTLSPEVERYREDVRQQAILNNIPEYVDLCLAIMMQESGGKCKDVFQCSESLGLPVNSIDTQKSIEQGVKVIADRLRESGVTDPRDLVNIKTALQGYNFGGGYIKYALKTDGYWTQENTNAYAKDKSKGATRSGKAAERLGVWKYGDQYYTAHVLRYYVFGVVASNDIVAVAEQQLGKEYVWGATGPDSFDCSGLVYYCYKMTGSTIGRLSAQGYYDAATICTYEELNPGDLVFYDSGFRIHHIAIYVGDGKVIHAPCTGQKVKVSTVQGAGSSSDKIYYGKL